MRTSNFLTPKWLFSIALLLLLAVTPILADIFDQAFYLSIATRILILTIAAISLNFILG